MLGKSKAKVEEHKDHDEDKGEWSLESKYNIGKKKQVAES